MKTLSRSAGRSATAAAAYRSGQKIEDARTGQTYDYSRRSGVLLAEVMTPDGRPLDRAQLWNAVESAEKRCNSVVAREFVVALPHELSREQQTALVKGYAHGLSERTGWAVDVAIHEPGREGDLRNVHAHLLCTTRTIERDPSSCPVMGSKTRDWDQRSSGSILIRSERSEWERCVNQSLELAHRMERVDCRSHADKGTELEPQIHLGPTAMAMERQGIQTERGDEHRRIAAHNAQVIELSIVRMEKAQEEAFQVDLEIMKTLPLAELETARLRYELQSVLELADVQESVKPEKDQLDSHRKEQRRLEAALSRVHDGQRDNGMQERCFRESYPWQARLHDLQVLPNEILGDIQAQGKTLHDEKVELEAALTVSRMANMQSMQKLEILRGEAYPAAMLEQGRQMERFREVEEIYQPRKQAHEIQLKVLAQRERVQDIQRWERMGVKELEAEAEACSDHKARSVAFESPEVWAAYRPLQGAHYLNATQYEAFLNKEFGQCHEHWGKKLKDERDYAARSLKRATTQEAEWVKSHPVKAALYEVGVPNQELTELIQEREQAKQTLAKAEKALGVFAYERAKAEDRLEAAIDKVMPQAEKEAASRRERYEAIQKVLKPKQELARQQQRKQERQKEQERGRGGGRGMGR